MHLDEEHIQRFLHGELAQSRESTARAHLATCAVCRARLHAAERDENQVHTLLRHLDHPMPNVDAGELALRAGRRAPSWQRWAASIALAVGLGGAAYAIPGSPLPGWIDSVVGRVAQRAPRQSPPATDAEVQPGRGPEPAIAGIAVAPGPDVRITFTSPHGRSRVSLGGGSEIVVRAPAGAATFTSHVDRIVVHNVDPSATIEIEIPRDASRVEISLGSETLFLKEGPRITTLALPTSDAYTLELGASHPGVQSDTP